jgi:hypothetical protein
MHLVVAGDRCLGLCRRFGVLGRVDDLVQPNDRVGEIDDRLVQAGQLAGSATGHVENIGNRHRPAVFRLQRRQDFIDRAGCGTVGYVDTRVVERGDRLQEGSMLRFGA